MAGLDPIDTRNELKLESSPSTNAPGSFRNDFRSSHRLAIEVTGDLWRLWIEKMTEAIFGDNSLSEGEEELMGNIVPGTV